MTSMPSAKAPVLVIDLQTGMFTGSSPLHDGEGLTRRVREVLAWARRTGRHVAFVQQNSEPPDQLAPGAPGWPIWPALGQAPDEPTLGKTEKNAFTSRPVRDWVAAQDVDEVVVIGGATNHCIAATVGGAMANGYKVTVIADAHATGGEGAPQIIADHNAAFAAAAVRMLAVKDLA